MKAYFFSVIGYFDQVHFWFNQSLRTHDLDALCHLNNFNPVTGKRMKMPGPGNNKWVYSLWITAPTDKALHYLHHNFAFRYRISHVEIAADYLCHSHEHARKLARYFDKHLVKKWLRNTKVKYKNTIYMGKSTASSRVVGYERISKVTGDPCYHLEFRVRRRSLQRLNLRTIPGLFALDFTAFFQRYLTLIRFDMNKVHLLGAALRPKDSPRYAKLGQYGNTYYDYHRRAGYTLVRALSEGETSIDCQSVKDYLRRWNLNMRLPLFKMMDNGGYLPTESYLCAQSACFADCECSKLYQTIPIRRRVKSDKKPTVKQKLAE